MRAWAKRVMAIVPATILSLACAVAGCVVAPARPPRAEIATPPPPPANEAPISCADGFVRMAGHFRWNGYGYVWVAQRCVHRPGFRWEPARYESCGDGWCYREGVWVPLTGK